MKRVIYLLMFAGVLLTSCKKDPIGGTATQALAGEWYVIADVVDESGDLIEDGEDFYGIGRFMLNTYNTAANIPTEMWVDDKGDGTFWDFKSKVNTDVNALTFNTNGAAANEYYDCQVTIDGGKIIPAGTVNPHGTRADSIVFFVKFSDDTYAAQYGYAKMRVSGFRYTGLAQDN